jgi:ferredoxin-type protein NapH
LPSQGGTFCVFCQHCRDPQCLAACPQRAVSRDAGGIVRIDKSLCVNCGLCREACLEAAPVRTVAGGIQKCDLCVNQGQPACVAACPQKALIYSAGKKLRWISWLRWPVQTLAFLLLAVVLVGSVCSLSIAAFDLSCPAGVLQNIFSSKTLLLTSLTAAGVLVLVSLLAGRFFCGWVCPFGFVLDLADKIAPRIFRLPTWLGNRLNKYGVLAGALIGSSITGNQAFCTVCPIGAVCRGYGLQSTLGGAELAVVPLIASLDLAGKRSWCRYFCPVGAVFALFSRLSLLGVRINARRCRKFSCLRCADVCPVGIIPAAALRAGINPDISRAECISCLRCVDVCPYRAARLRLFPFALPKIMNRKFQDPAPGSATASMETKV